MYGDALPIRKKLVSRSRCSALRVLKMEEDSQNQGEALFLAPAPSPGLNPKSCGRFRTPEDGRWRCHMRNSPKIGLKCENGEHSLATLTVFSRSDHMRKIMIYIKVFLVEHVFRCCLATLKDVRKLWILLSWQG